MKQSIGILDAELLFSKTRQPNLSCLKLSGYYKKQGAPVTLLEKAADVLHCKTVYLAKVFPETVVLQRDPVTPTSPLWRKWFSRKRRPKVSSCAS